jgi:hypothetical protein
MAVQQSDTQRNARLDAISTTWGASPLFRIYSGTPPVDESTALSGNTLLAVVTLTPAAASAGAKNMLGTTQTTTGAAAGTAAFYRVYNSSGTTSHEQGLITATGGGGDATIDNISIASGQTVNVTNFTKTEPG